MLEMIIPSIAIEGSVIGASLWLRLRLLKQRNINPKILFGKNCENLIAHSLAIFRGVKLFPRCFASGNELSLNVQERGGNRTFW